MSDTTSPSPSPSEEAITVSLFDPMPHRYVFVPDSDNNKYLMAECRLRTRAIGRPVYVVHDGRDVAIGLRVPHYVVEPVLFELAAREEEDQEEEQRKKEEIKSKSQEGVERCEVLPEIGRSPETNSTDSIQGTELGKDEIEALGSCQNLDLNTAYDPDPYVVDMALGMEVWPRTAFLRCQTSWEWVLSKGYLNRAKDEVEVRCENYADASIADSDIKRDGNERGEGQCDEEFFDLDCIDSW
jgi:hypothetical protein